MDLNNLLSSLFGSGKNKIEHEPIIETVNENLDSGVEPMKTVLSLDDEIMVLARHFGGIAQGAKLTIDLHELLGLCDRRRHKADAYLGLKKKLRDEYGAELIITSKNSKTQKNNEKKQ